MSTKVTFFSKKPLECPVCGTHFFKEELFSGGGRLVAGELADDLRRRYEPSKKFGELYPLIYYMMVCPNCWYAAFPSDFHELPASEIDALNNDSLRRRESVNLLFSGVNFSEPRGLSEGVASYILGAMCYEFFDKKSSPTIKQGICCLRAAWLCDDLHRKEPEENYDYLNKVLYRKASFFYSIAVELEQTGKESLGGVRHMGPDLDKNYGYDGLLYLAGYLVFHHGARKDVKKRYQKLEGVKRIVAKMHGIGKVSKNKPSIILNKAKDLYDEIGKELEELKKELE